MLRIHLLGDLRVDGAAVPEGRPGRALLAWLALHPGPHPRAHVAARLWPDTLDRSARTNLRSALLDLRRAFGPEWEGALVARGDTLALEAWVDRRAVVEALREGRPDAALALLGAELLPGWEEEWVVQVRDAHRADAIAALEALAAAAEAQGDQATAVGRTREQAEVDPLDEEVARRLMRRLAETGNRAAALEAYGRLGDRLRRALAVAPSAATRDLARELRHGEQPAPATGGPLPLPATLSAAAAPGQPFVGREDDLRALREHWSQAAAGAPRAIALSGEPGIGKTRLAAVFAGQVHGAGGQVLFGRCAEGPPMPYAPLIEALEGFCASRTEEEVGALAGPLLSELARLVPSLGARVEGAAGSSSSDREEQRGRLVSAASAFLAAIAGAGPTVLVIDDAHLLDPYSAAVLQHLLRPGRPLGLLLLLTARDTEPAPVLATLEPAPLRLGGFGFEHTLQLVSGLMGGAAPAGVGERIHRATAGNPLYTAQLVRHLAEGRRLGEEDGELPPTLLETVGRRVARLGEDVRRLLEAAAVAGDRFDLRVLARVLERSPADVVDALDVATAAGIVTELPGPPNGRYAFVHGLLRRALYERLSGARRAILHDRFADVLAERGGDDALPERIDHVLQGLMDRDAADVVALALAAADRHNTLFAYDDAATVLGRTAQAFPPEDEPHLTELRLALGGALQRAGRSTAAEPHLRAALVQARANGDQAAVSRAVLALGGLGTTIVTPDPQLIAELECAAADARDEDERSLLTGRLAIELYYTGETTRREVLSAEALASARRSGRPEVLASALTARRVAIWSPDHLAERLALTAEAVDVAVAAGLAEPELEARNWRYVDLVEAGRIGEARRELEAYERLSQHRRLPRFHWYATLWQASFALAAGEFARSRTLLAAAIAEGQAAGDANAHLFADGMSGEWVDRGRIPSLGDQQQRSQSRAHTPAYGAYLAVEAWILAATGRRDAACERFDELAADDFTLIPRDANRLACLSGAAFACWELRDAARAERVRPMLEPYAEHVLFQARAVHLLGSVSTCLSQLTLLVGDVDTAVALVRRAVAADEANGLVTRAVHARLTTAEALGVRRRPGDLAEARRTAQRARAEARRMGLDGVEARAAELAERLG